MNVHRAAQGFDRAVDVYERARPEYPDEAVAWLVDKLTIGPGRTVVDLAAGSGKLTKRLTATGARVIAVEPSRPMLDRLREVAAGAEAVEGTAEAIPLPGASADAVTVAQAFHWFANDRALGEIHRVLRPGAGLGLAWNRRRLDAPAQVALNELIEPYEQPSIPRQKSGDWRTVIEATPLFEAAGSFELPWSQQVDRAGFVARFASTSFIAALEPDEHAGAVAKAERAANGFAEPIELPYVAELFVYTRH